MKKLVVFLALISFVGFGALSIQNIVASPAQVEMVKFDKNPKKASDKKVASSKETKVTESKAANTDTKVSVASGSDKSATTKSCSDKDKAGCCSSSPDKK